jgi:hypothetical protein
MRIPGRGWAIVCVAAGAAWARAASAHELDCDLGLALAVPDASGAPAMRGDLPDLAGPGPRTVLRVSAYPALVAFSATVRGLGTANDVATGVAPALPPFGALRSWSYGAALFPGMTLAPGTSVTHVDVVRVRSYDECVALAGAPRDAAVCPATADAALALAFDGGAAECRARLVCQPPRWETPQFGTPGNDFATGVAVDAAGRVRVGGFTDGQIAYTWGTNGGEQTFFAMLSAAGGLASLTGYANSARLRAFGLSGDAAGNTVQGGVYEDATTGSQTWFRNSAGIGTSSWGGPGSAAYAVAWDEQGDALVAGTSLPWQAGTSQASAWKIDPLTMQLRWVRTIDATATWEMARGVAPDGAGGAYVAGLSAPASSARHAALVARIDAAGDLLWVKRFGPPGTEALAASPAPDGGVYVAGMLASDATPALAQGFLDRYDEAGNRLFRRVFTTSTSEIAFAVATDGAGDAWVAGSTAGDLGGKSLGEHDVWVARIRPDGTSVWTTQFGTARDDQPAAIAVDDLGQAFVAGSTQGAFPGAASAGGWDAFVVRLGPDGTVR